MKNRSALRQEAKLNGSHVLRGNLVGGISVAHLA